MKKVFLVANEKAYEKKCDKEELMQKGISMISLVIMIIVILILAGVIFSSSNRSIESTGRGIFVRELSLVQQAASEKRLDNQVFGTSEEKTNKGFYKAQIKNPPANFVSFSDDEVYGYVIDLEYADVEDADRGHDYPLFAVDIDSNIVEFGKDDVYIYDKNGNVFYAKGFEGNDGIYYSKDEISKFGPEIISIDKTISADGKSATITIVVKKNEDGNLSVTVGGKDATRVSTSEEEKTETFEITVYENKTYVVVAKEDSAVTTGTITVSELDVVTFVISYDANGGVNAPVAQLKTENVIMNLSTQIPTKVGNTFLGWNENPSATIATYRPGGEFVLDKDTTLFAIWKVGEERTYSVIYNANGGENAPATAENVSGEYTITTEIPSRDGYGFLGWSENASDTEATYVGGESINVNKNVMLYAIWEMGKYSVIATTQPENAGSNIITGENPKAEGAEVYISTIPNPGFTFKNWSIKSGNVNLRNTTSPVTSFTMPANNVEIVANYDVGKLSVKYNANKGNGTPEDEEVEYGTKIQITSMTPTRTGYDFLGWALSPEAGTPEYFSGDEYTVNENIVFYAVWNAHIETYTIKYNLNTGFGNASGGIGNFADQIKTQGIPFNIVNDEPYKEGWTFKGWSLAADSDEIVLRPGDTYVRDADLEIFAVWKDETPPTVSITTRQEENSTEIQMIGTAHDEGDIAGYAWTMSNEPPIIWEVDGVGEKDLVVEKTIIEKGGNYFWAKDRQGNVNVQSLMAYEITYDANGGVGAPAKQFQVENTDLVLTTVKPTREEFVFLGWSTAAVPGNLESDVQFLSGSKLNLNADTTLRAVWGESFFGLSAYTGVTQIDGQNNIINVIPGAYTGNITVSSSDTEKATATISNNVITIVPGQKIGDVEIKVVEDNQGTTETIIVTVNRGIRNLTLDKTEVVFTYGDPSEKINFSYNGKTPDISIRESVQGIVSASVSGKTLTITPENYGTTTLTLVLAQDEQYLEKSAEIQVSVVKQILTVTPDSGQKKVYDGTTSNAELTFKCSGQAAGETPAFDGALERVAGSDVGLYEIKLGNLTLVNNGEFVAENYTLNFSSQKVYFEITPKRVTMPLLNVSQAYDGTTKYVVLGGMDYTRGGDYAKTNAGKYTAILTLNDSKNFIWDDTGKNTARTIPWEITPIDVNEGTLEIESIPNSVYTGYSINPKPTVKFNGMTLALGTDYSLSYENNINVGTAKVTINFKGNYKGNATRTFNITPAVMQVDSAGYSGTFDNQSHSITVTPIWPSNGYTIYYAESELTSSNFNTLGSTTKPAKTNAGSYTIYYYITSSNFGSYSGHESIKIEPKSILNLALAYKPSFNYTGSVINPSVTIKDNEQNRTLSQEVDYSVSYENSINVGISKFIISGLGNYKDSRTVEFSIKGDTITFAKTPETLATTVNVSISKIISITTLQYKINNGSWEDYTGPLTITSDCTIYARSVHNGNVIGSNQISITNIFEHSYTEVTCTTDSTCKYCGILNEEKLGHDFTSQTVSSTYLKSEATCTSPAIYYYKCSRCTSKGAETYSTGEAMGHDFTSQTATSTYLKSSATCTTKAVYYYKCSRCTAKGTETYEYGKLESHTFTSKTTTIKYLASSATCTKAETYYYKCSKCSEKGTNTYSYGSPLNHDYTSKTVNDIYKKSSATCTSPAVYYYKCSRCQFKGTTTYTQGVALGHDYAGATCTAPATCTRCNATSGAALGHDYAAATCTKAATCKRCSATSGAALGHDYAAATCTKAATCKRCNATSGVALGHDYAAATCTKAATCKRCNTTSGVALGHDYSKYEVTKTANCCSTGTGKYTCARCSVSYEVTIQKDASNHTGPYTTKTTAATCTQTGKEEKICSGCGVVTSTTTIAKKSHTYAAATCTKPKTCKNCGATTGNANGHSYASATCQKPKTCKVCGATSGSKVAHDYTKVSVYEDYDDQYHRIACSYGCGTYKNVKHTLTELGGKRWFCDLCGLMLNYYPY